MFKNRYRIVRDNYAGYEAQVKFWWFPLIWFQINDVNTHSSLERAVQMCEWHSKNNVVKEL